jgi:hypothetical protein
MVSRFRGWLDMQKVAVREIPWLQRDASLSLAMARLDAIMDAHEHDTDTQQQCLIHAALSHAHAGRSCLMLICCAITIAVAACVYASTRDTHQTELALLVVLAACFPACIAAAQCARDTCNKTRAQRYAKRLERRLHVAKRQIKTQARTLCTLLDECRCCPETSIGPLKQKLNTWKHTIAIMDPTTTGETFSPTSSAPLIDDETQPGAYV